MNRQPKSHQIGDLRTISCHRNCGTAIATYIVLNGLIIMWVIAAYGVIFMIINDQEITHVCRIKMKCFCQMAENALNGCLKHWVKIIIKRQVFFE